MWHPTPARRHPLPTAHWPTAEAAAAGRWFRPIRIAGTTVLQRTWVPAMVPWRATEDGLVTDDVVAWYRRFAAGRPGVIVVEATGIRDVPSGPLLRAGHDRFIPGLQRLVEAVREASHGETRLFLQLIDFLAVKRRPQKAKYFERFLALSERHRAALVAATGDGRWRDAPEADVRARLAAADDALLDRVLDWREQEALRFGYRERVTDLHLPHVRELPAVLPGLFAAAAARARTAGFDGVELHYAHAYTMASFLSRLNTRDDGYGGKREQRVKVPLLVLRAVRRAVGGEYPVGVRFLGDEVIDGGNRIEDATWFALEFARAGFDFLSISKGGRFEDAKQPAVGAAVYPYTGPSGYECMPTVISDEKGPFGRNVALAAGIRRAVRELGYDTPVVTAGGICTFEQAEQILARGDADIVAAARQSLADPDWFRKVRLGLGAQVRRCEFTNYCEGLDQMHKQVTCKLWDRAELGEPGLAKSADGRRLLAPSWSPPETPSRPSLPSSAPG
ncbi:MAG: NADH:flavin oxidoreductase [Planctomycetes bacterium]|nr:NADH:flavin oxidoreductase [Planctomycetota bacterium]